MISTGALLVAAAAFAGAFGLSAVLTPLVRRWAMRADFVDRPSGPAGHKQHRAPVPFGGGIAITAAILLPMAGLVVAAWCGIGQQGAGWFGAWLPQASAWLGGVQSKATAAWAVIGGAIVLHIMGLIDDRRPLSAGLKWAVQWAVALVLSGGFGIRSGDALGPVPAVLLTSLWIVTLTNAFNFMDNMDGLAGGVAGLTAVVLAVAALLAGQVFVPCMLLLAAGAVSGFLLYNIPPARIFMGDAGSLVVGYFLAVCAVLTTFYDPDQQRTPYGVLVPVVVFAVPLYDMASVMIRRWRQGVSVFRADRRHFSHRLVNLGMSPTTAVLTIWLATAATALPALLLPRLDWPGAVLVFGQCLCVVILIALLEARRGPETQGSQK